MIHYNFIFIYYMTIFIICLSLVRINCNKQLKRFHLSIAFLYLYNIYV